MQIEQHGKLLFRFLEETDIEKLLVFCRNCENLGYVNNSSFKSMKLSQIQMPYGKFFIGIDEEKDIIFNIAGIHKFLEINKNSYRALFRGAVLPGYTTGRGLLKESWQFTVTLKQQINFILSLNPHAEFYLTSNKKQDRGKSSKIDQFFNPRAEQAGLISLIEENFYYMNTEQRLWKINVGNYLNWLF